MKKSRILSIALACAYLFISIPASAAIYSITFYQKTGPGDNLFDTDEFIVSGTGSFEINDAAVTPNNLVLFSDSNFLAFDATITATVGSARFTLGVDDFPPFGDGTSTVHTAEQGILFDASGQPYRFDNPAITFGNSPQICDPTCDTAVGNKAGLVLYDEDGFDTVFLNDGTLTTRTFATSNGHAFTPLGGEWNFKPLGSISAISNNLYLIQAVPVPAAVWLFGSGLLGLVGVARRKKAA
jgi:hypothetical protein